MRTFPETPFNFIKNYYSAFHFNMAKKGNLSFKQ